MEANNELMERLFQFSVSVIFLLRKMPKSEEMYVIRRQLIRSSSSSGANYEEAQAGSSRADFSNKVRISLREMRESNYWLRIICATTESKTNEELDRLVKESQELKLILGTIVHKTSPKK